MLLSAIFFAGVPHEPPPVHLQYTLVLGYICVLISLYMLQLQRIMAELLLSERRSVRASGLLSSLPVFFQGGRQQDAHEAGRYLLTCVDTHWHRLFPATAAAAASGGDASSLSASASVKVMEAKPTRVF